MPTLATQAALYLSVVAFAGVSTATDFTGRDSLNQKMQKNRGVGMLWIAGQTITSIAGSMIDTGRLNFVYNAALPIIFINISVCFLGA